MHNFVNSDDEIHRITARLFHWLRLFDRI